MTAENHQTFQRKLRQFWLKEENILGTLGALLAFAFIYAYSGDADLYYPLVGALGMGGVVYMTIWLALRSNF